MCCEIFWFQRGSQVRRFSAEIEPWIHRPHELNLGARRPSTSKRSARRFARHWLVPSVPGHLGSWWHLQHPGPNLYLKRFGDRSRKSNSKGLPPVNQDVLPISTLDILWLDGNLCLWIRLFSCAAVRSHTSEKWAAARLLQSAHVWRGFCCTPLVERRWSTLVSERMPLEPKGLSCFFHTFSPWIGNFGAYFSLGRSHKAAAEMVWTWRGLQSGVQLALCQEVSPTLSWCDAKLVQQTLLIANKTRIHGKQRTLNQGWIGLHFEYAPRPRCSCWTWGPVSICVWKEKSGLPQMQYFCCSILSKAPDSRWFFLIANDVCKMLPMHAKNASTSEKLQWACSTTRTARLEAVIWSNTNPVRCSNCPGNGPHFTQQSIFAWWLCVRDRIAKAMVVFTPTSI